MAASISIKFGNLTLAPSVNLAIAPISISENKRINFHNIPKSDGSIAEEAKRESIKISMQGILSGADYDAVRNALNDLESALQNGFQKFTIDDERFILAQMQSFKKNFRAMRTYIAFNAEFVAHYPFWISEDENVDDRTPTTTVGYVINNAGNAISRCKVEFTAPAGGIDDDIKLENQTNGNVFRFRGEISAADVLLIDNRYDTDDFKVENDGADAFADFEGDFFTLSPGDNTIVFTGPADTDVKITYRDAWY